MSSFDEAASMCNADKAGRWRRSDTCITMYPLRFLGLSAVLFLATFFPVLGRAQEAAADTSSGGDEPPANLIGKAVDYVDDAQHDASVWFGDFMTQVDGFFSDAETGEEALSNTSWARIRLNAQRPAGEDFKFDPSLKLRLALPNTERRFKLLLSTEDDDTELVGEGVESAQGTSGGDQNASAAIRFIRTARTNGSVNLDLGVRQRDGDVQYFTRLNTGYKSILKRRWDFSVSNSYWYYSKSGFEDRLSFAFKRKLYYQDDFFFRSYTEFNWRKGNKGAIIGQTVGLYTWFGESRALAIEALAGYHTALNAGVEDRFRGHEFRLRWRHNVWRPWFFYEVWPSVSWPSTTDYNRSYGLLIRLEMVIGQR